MKPTLAIDIGGTKTLVALVQGEQVLGTQTAPTSRADGPEQWIEQSASLAGKWQGQYDLCGVTVTGAVRDGLWSAMNPKTLNIPDSFPIAQQFSQVINVPTTICNDAQAAAWGEYQFGAGQGKDTVFLTVSTGIGGGAVANGRLVQGHSGVGGHFGLLLADNDAPIEDLASGQWIAAEAARQGHKMSTPEVFSSAALGEDWAAQIIDESARLIARLCHNLQLIFDPEVIVIGGGVGLAEGYLAEVRKHVENLPARVPSTLARAALGANAGVLGIAALANLHNSKGD